MRAPAEVRELSSCDTWAQLPHGMWESQLPDQGSNLHPPHCKEDSLPLDHQGSPTIRVFFNWKIEGEIRMKALQITRVIRVGITGGR